MIDTIRSKILPWIAWQNRSSDKTDDASNRLKRNMPLVPADSIAGRALVIVIAIMTFLASLSAGAGILVSDASRGWIESVSKEMTIQIKPIANRDVEADVAKAADLARAASGIRSVRVYSKAEAERLLEPWLGSGLDLSELPVPRLIVLELDPGRIFDASALRQSLRTTVPSAMLDDHRLWIDRLAIMARTLVVIVAVVFVLVLVAMLLAVAFATRGAMAGNREIISILHFVGATDNFIAREFQFHFFRLGCRGGLIGGICALVIFFVSSLLSGYWSASAEGDQLEALFGTFSLGFRGYVSIALIALGIAFLTGLMSRLIVARHLRTLV